MTRPRIAVVGGGVTGLAAAYELRDDADVTVFEASERLGGKIDTGSLDGIQIEGGPDSLLARDEEPIRLLEQLGLSGDVVEPRNFGAWIALDGGLKRLPEGFVLGVPASPVAIVRSGLLSPAGIVRAGADLILPRTKVGADISVGELVRARFGDQVADRIVAPLMSGIRSGDIDQMSLDMAAPQIAGVARSHRSLTLGLRKARRSMSPPRFVGLRGGMSSLVERLRDASRAEVLLSASVTSIRPDMTIDGRPFDGAVLAVPPFAARTILDLPPSGEVSFASGSVVNLVYPPGAVRPPESGSGILVPPNTGRSLVAATWFTSKWPHLDPGDGRSVIRCFASGDTSESAVTEELADLLDIRSAPLATRTHRWDAAMPEFKVGHRARVSELERGLAARPVRLVGAGFLATGINDCLAHGRAAAREVVAAARA